MIALYSIDKSHSLEERENFFLDVKQQEWRNAVLLSTCNRVEVYFGTGFVTLNIVEHLFNVSAGLKSSFIGESAILGQIKTAYQKAAAANPLDKSLHRLFQTALLVGKRVRTETDISKGAVSHGQAAVSLLLRHFSTLENKTVTFIGTGKINETILKFLQRKGIQTFFVGNRSFDKAKDWAVLTGGEAFKLDQLYKVLEYTDILISSTSAPHIIVKPEHIPAGKPLFIIDLAVPHDVDKEIGLMPNIHLHNIEDVELSIEQNIGSRLAEIEKAKTIVSEEVDKFIAWQMRQPELSN